MNAEQQQVYTATERSEMGAAARALGAAERREYTDAERIETIAALRAWPGTRTAFAIARGIPKTTLSRWATGDRRPHRARASRPPEGQDQTPMMLEVVPVAATTASRAPASSPVHLVLGGGVALVFDTLPPASWVATLAAELRQC